MARFPVLSVRLGPLTVLNIVRVGERCQYMLVIGERGAVERRTTVTLENDQAAAIGRFLIGLEVPPVPQLVNVHETSEEPTDPQRSRARAARGLTVPSPVSDDDADDGD